MIAGSINSVPAKWEDLQIVKLWALHTFNSYSIRISRSCGSSLEEFKGTDDI